MPQQQHDLEFWRLASTALCLIRDGANGQRELRAALGLPPLAMADLLEGLEENGLIGRVGHLVWITLEGRQSVPLIQLVKDAGEVRIFERWTPDDTDRPLRSVA